MSVRWYQPSWKTSSNTLQLLQGSHEFFGALVAAIDCSEHSVWLETYIFDSNEDAEHVCAALEQAALRGVAVRLLLDGVGSMEFSAEWQVRLRKAGVALRYFASPGGRLGLLLPKYWRRLHRKLCVIDGQMAFCGGINILDDYHDPNHGQLSKPRWDFAVQVTSGKLVQHIAQVCEAHWWQVGGKAEMRLGEKQVARPFPKSSGGQSTHHHSMKRTAFLRHPLRSWRSRQAPQSAAVPPPFSTSALLDKFQTVTFSTDTHFPQITKCTARLLLRDNLRNRHSIEKAYLAAIDQAQHRIVIANAYFFPSNKLLKALVRASKRGVKVQLLLQGRYEYFMQYYAIKALYPRLIAAGVEVYEYHDSFLHSKVAVVDAGEPHAWATVGSSNLDPLSLLFAKEANIEVLDDKFARVLLGAIEQAILHSSKHIDESQYLRKRSWWARRVDRFAYFWARLATWVLSSEY